VKHFGESCIRQFVVEREEAAVQRGQFRRFALVGLLRRGCLSKGSAVDRNSLFLFEGLTLRDVGLGKKIPPASRWVSVPALRKVSGLQDGLLSGWWGCAQLQQRSAICRFSGHCSSYAVGHLLFCSASCHDYLVFASFTFGLSNLE